MTPKLTPPLKWHGGKSYLASRIVPLMPAHVHYVEPFAGGLAVLLAKDPEEVSEAVNDLDGDLVNFWRVLQHPRQFSEFVRACQATPFAEAEYGRACVELDFADGPVGRAWAFFVLCRQSLAGRMNSFAPLSRNRTRRGMNEQASAWLGAVDGLPEVHARLRRVVILGPKDAGEVIRQQDGDRTMFYCDPPYFPDSRAAPDVYAHEMTAQGHRDLLGVLTGVKGKVMLSGYRCPMYDDLLTGWRREDFDLPNNSACGAKKRRMVESVWMNYGPATEAAGNGR
jgi:DNA adenine methylase